MSITFSGNITVYTERDVDKEDVVYRITNLDSTYYIPDDWKLTDEIMEEGLGSGYDSSRDEYDTDTDLDYMESEMDEDCWTDLVSDLFTNIRYFNKTEDGKTFGHEGLTCSYYPTYYMEGDEVKKTTTDKVMEWLGYEKPKPQTLNINYEMVDGDMWEMNTVLCSVLKPFGWEEVGRGHVVGGNSRDLHYEYNPDIVTITPPNSSE